MNVRFKFIKLLLLTALLSACGDARNERAVPTEQERLINGISVEHENAPQLVEIILMNAGQEMGRCTGTAIAEDAVLTAGHCVQRGEDELLVRTPAGILPARDAVRHPGYREDFVLSAVFNDVAIIHVDSLQLPALPLLLTRSPQPGDVITTYGFGIDGSGSFGRLNAAPIHIEIVTPNHIFSEPFSEDGANPCLGDSGAPAVFSYEDEAGVIQTAVVGTVSSGTKPNCEKGDVTLFANIQNPAILEFISQAAPGAAVH